MESLIRRVVPQVLSFGEHLPSRPIWLIDLDNGRGQKAQGEVSPLRGWSAETSEEVAAQLHLLAQRRVPFDEQTLFPSVQFAIESALHSLECPELPAREIAAFLDGSPEQILAEGQIAAQEGFRWAKVKLRSLHPTDALPLVTELQKLFRLRIDLNRSWSDRDSLYFFSQISPSNIDYVEEPLANLELLTQFPLPFALDETVREGGAISLLALPHCVGLVWKPSLSGGFSRCKSWETHLASLGKQIILSSAYEGRIGTQQILRLAGRLQHCHPVLGLGTSRWQRT